MLGCGLPADVDTRKVFGHELRVDVDIGMTVIRSMRSILQHQEQQVELLKSLLAACDCQMMPYMPPPNKPDELYEDAGEPQESCWNEGESSIADAKEQRLLEVGRGISENVESQLHGASNVDSPLERSGMSSLSQLSLSQFIIDSVRTVKNSAQDSNKDIDAHFFEHAPFQARFVFALAGVLHWEAVPHRLLRMAYRIYCYSVLLSYAVCAVNNASNIFVKLFVLEYSLEHIIFDIAFLPLFVVVLPCAHCSLKDAFHEGGSLALAAKGVSKLGYDWAQNRTKKLLACLSLFIVVFCGEFLHGLITGESLAHKLSSKQRSMGTIFLTFKWTVLVSYVIGLISSFSYVWIISFVCTLFKHELWCYMAVVRYTFKKKVVGERSLEILRNLEHSISEDFRHASETWVQWVVAISIWGMFLSVVSTAFFWGAQVPEMIFHALVFCIAGCFVVRVSTTPLTDVAEHYEYDVLKELNNLETIANSVDYVGSEGLWTHLQALDWGFRCGGSVVNSRQVSAILGSLIVGALAIISESIWNQTFE